MFLAAPAEQLCSTPICKQSAKYISDGLNASADPCEDFNEFACGGWRSKHTIPDSKTRIGTFDSLNEIMKQQLKELLDKYDLQAKLKTDSAAVSYSAYLYQSCLKLGNESAAVGLTQLKEVVDSVLGYWNIGKQLKMMDRSWHDNFVRAYTKGSMSPIFSIGIGPDAKDVTTNILNVSLYCFTKKRIYKHFVVLDFFIWYGSWR